MALAETELESQKQDSSQQTLGRDEFVKRRQEARAAAGDGGTDAPGDGDEASPLEEAVEGAGEQETEGAAETPEGAEAESEANPFAEIFDDDELGVEAEPSKLTGLEPPASLSAAEKEAFESAPDELKGIIARVSKAAAQKVTESGETVAARNKEIDDRVAQLDRALIEAKAVLDVNLEEVPFEPPFSEDDLDKIFSEEGAEAEREAKKQNRGAKAKFDQMIGEAKAKRDEQKAKVDEQIKDRQKQIAERFRDELPKLIPAWKNDGTRKKEAGELSTYLSSSGFSEAELKVVADARLVMLARKAMKYDRALKKARDRQGGKAKQTTARAAPANGRAPSKASNSAELDAAIKAHREKPTADTFARVRKLKREAQAAANSRRRV